MQAGEPFKVASKDKCLLGAPAVGRKSPARGEPGDFRRGQCTALSHQLSPAPVHGLLPSTPVNTLAAPSSELGCVEPGTVPDAEPFPHYRQAGGRGWQQGGVPGNGEPEGCVPWPGAPFPSLSIAQPVPGLPSIRGRPMPLLPRIHPGCDDLMAKTKSV